MKKLLALILALTMVFALAACGSEPAANSDAPSGDDVPSGEAVELTLTCNGTDQGNDTRSAKRFKELIEEETNGRITINIINNDQLAGGNMTSAIELLTGGGTDIDIHSTSIISSIAAHRSSVDFPDPDGPMIESTSPSSTLREISFNTSRSPKLFLTWFISR